MKIRKGTRSNMKEATRLLLKFFPDGEITKIAKYYLKERLGDGETLVAIEKGRVVGFLTFSKNYFVKSDCAQFLAINEMYQKMGIGTALMEAFELQARRRKCRRVFSSIEPWNKISMRFHKKLGYERCGYVDHTWKEGSRDLFFSKKL